MVVCVLILTAEAFGAMVLYRCPCAWGLLTSVGDFVLLATSAGDVFLKHGGDLRLIPRDRVGSTCL